jgi:hypothetical protein
MKPHRLLLAAALGLTITGCGGSSAPNPVSAAVPAGATTPVLVSPQVHGALTRHKYIRVAGGVCAKLKGIAANGNQAVGQALAANQPDAAATAVQRFYPAYAQELLLLEGIRPPVADRPRMRRLLGIMEAQTRTLPLYARALRASDRQVLRAVTAAQHRLAVQAEAISRPYGFKICGR